MLALILALQTATATATIRGHVYAADSSQPLRKAQVRLSGTQTRENRLATTDADGKYEFKDLPAGRYNLNASKGSYVSVSWGQLQPNEPGKPLDILDGQTVERVDFVLPRGSLITGRIVDEFGEPLSNVTVAAVRSQIVNGQRRMVPTGRTGGTNDLGEFRIYGLTPGQYYVQATWRRPGPMNDPNTPDRLSYPVTYFPGTTELSSAQRFTIAIGQSVTDLAMALSPIKTALVTGMVVDAEGKPLGAMMLNVMQSDGNSFTSNFGTSIRGDGSFSFVLQPGNYTLRTMANGTSRRDVGALVLTVGTEDITDLRIVVAPPPTISGRIVVDPAQAQSLPPGMMVTAVPATPMPMPGNSPARIADDFSFELSVPITGRVRIIVNNLAPSWAISHVRVNTVDVIDDGIDVKPNDKIDGVEIELTNKLTSVSGTVSASAGTPAKDYTVVFFPQDSKRWVPGSRYLRSARPDQDGRFKISGLPAGDYNVIAVERIEAGQNTDPEYLDRISSRATRFTLLDAETRTLDLKLDTSK